MTAAPPVGLVCSWCRLPLPDTHEHRHWRQLVAVCVCERCAIVLRASPDEAKLIEFVLRDPGREEKRSH